MILTLFDVIGTKIIPFILALAGFSFLVAFHEFGHFIFCKIFSIHAPTFSIGFGPKLLKRTIGSTTFCISAIPLGGYVEIAHNREQMESEQQAAAVGPDAYFDDRPYWQKLTVMLAGIACNILFAYVTFAGLFYFGVPKERGTVVLQSIEQSSAAAAAGLVKGDVLLGINKVTIDPDNVTEDLSGKILPFLAEHPNERVSLRILRDNKKLKIPATLGETERNGKTVGILGVSFGLNIDEVTGEYVSFSLRESIARGVERTHAHVRQMFSFLWSLVSTRSLKGAGGPIMILSTTFSMAQKSLRLLLVILAIISINLAVLNVLPIGALDGGRLLLITIEAIIRRKIPEKVTIAILLSFWVFFLSLTAVLSYRDILALFS